MLGVAPDVLNDDRIARALDALAPVLEQVTGSVGAAAIGRFGIERVPAALGHDLDQPARGIRAADDGYAQPRFGHPKDRRADLKQIQAGVATAADGAVPVFFKPYSGGAGEVSQVTGAMEALRRLAGPRRFLLAGDSKLLSYANIAAMIEAEVSFLAPASKSFVPAEVLAGCDYAAAAPATFVAERDRGRPEARRGCYRLIEDTMTITGPRKKDPAYTLRRVFVLLLRARRGRRARPGQETRAGRRGTGPAHPRPGLAALPRRRQGHRSHHRHRRRAGASATTCAPTPAPTETGGRHWTGTSTRPPSTPKPPPTAGTRC